MSKKNKIKFGVISLLVASAILIVLVICSLWNNFLPNYSTNDDSLRQDSLEFIYMDKSDVELGDSQKVYVSFYNHDYANKSSLTFHKEDSNEITVKPTFVSDEVALFDIPFTNNTDVGKYNFDRVSWTGDDAGYQNIDKSDKGYSFEVNPKESDMDSDELPAGIYNLNGDGSISEDDLLNASQTQMMLSNSAKSLDKPKNGITICLDPGHGGGEAGAVNYDWGLYEKNINLRIAQVCRNELQKYSGVRVIMTRDGDWDVGLQQRADIARDNGADLFVSFHNNSGGGSGAEVWVQYAGCSWHNEFNGIGTDIANRILDKLCNKMGLAYRGVKSDTYAGRTYPNGAIGDYFAVLYWSRYYQIPGILIEHAFIDMQPAFLANDANLVQMGIYDAQAIAEYYHLGAYGPSDILSGTYRIGSALNDNKVLQVQNKSTADMASIIVTDDDSSLSQRWKVETDDNEWVTIQNINSGKYLDIDKNKVFDGAKLQQYTKNDGDNQKWKIIKVNNKFKIVSKLSPLFVIDIPGHSLSPDNTLEMYTDNGGNNQLFSFTIDIPASDPDIEDGYYRISSKSNTSMVLDVVGSFLDDGTKIQTYDVHKERPNQIFKIERTGKYHKITNIVTDKVLDVEASTTKRGVQLEQWTDNSLLNQKWSIQKNKSDKYVIYSACNGQVLDCRGGKAKTENPVDLYNFHDSDNQLWGLDLYSYDIYKDLDNFAYQHKDDLEDGLYTIGSGINQSLVFDVYGGLLEDCANVQLYKNNYGANQKWEIKHDINTGYATIVNEKSGKYLEVYGKYKRESTNVEQYKKNNLLNQKWIIYKVGDSKFKMQSALIPMFYITVEDNTPHNESNVVCGYTNKDNKQNFYFEKLDVKIPPSDPSIKDGYYAICSTLNNKMGIDLEAHNIDNNAGYVLWENGKTAMNQQFKIKKYGNYHKIQNVVSDKYLIVEGDDSGNFYVVQNEESELSNQLWSIQLINGEYQFINVSNGFRISIYNDTVRSGAKIVAYREQVHKSQNWKMISVTDPFSTLDQLAAANKNTIVDGLYSIYSNAGNNLVLDVYAGSMLPIANVQLYSNNYSANQKWYIENADDNYVYIKNEKSGYYLDIEAAKKKNNTNVCQYSLSKNANQKWIIIKNGESYKIMSGSLLNFNLTAYNVPAYNETNIVSSYASSSVQQSFNFKEAQPTPPEPTTGTAICHASRTNVEKMMNYFNSTGHTYPNHYALHGYGGNTLYDFCNIIMEESIYEGVDPAVVFCQAMKETGWLTFTGDVNIDQCNFCGLGATGGGEPGCSFNDNGDQSVRIGIRAQVQHLKRYAVGTLNRPGKPVDPRFYLPDPGCAPTVEELGGHWAPNLTYGVEIVNMMKNCY